MNHTTELLTAFFKKTFLYDENASNIPKDASFLESGLIDSAGIMELVLFVEDTFNIVVADEELVPQNFDSINGLCSYITTKRG